MEHLHLIETPRDEIFDTLPTRLLDDDGEGDGEIALFERFEEVVKDHLFVLGASFFIFAEKFEGVGGAFGSVKAEKHCVFGAFLDRFDFEPDLLSRIRIMLTHPHFDIAEIVGMECERQEPQDQQTTKVLSHRYILC